MAHVARQMEREGLEIPLLIGGATTSKAHTAVKIAPARSHPVVHVLDASRAVPVAGSLLNPKQKPAFVEGVRAEQERLREQHGRTAPKLLSLEEARRRAPRLSYEDLPQPEFTGVRVLGTAGQVEDGGWRMENGALARGEARPTEDGSAGPAVRPYPAVAVSLADLVPFIDWSPFFHTWELRGRYPAILDHEKHGTQARQLFADAQTLLEEIVTRKLLTPRGVYGFFRARAMGDDVQLPAEDESAGILATFHFLRQQIEKPPGQPNYCLADFVAPTTRTSEPGTRTSSDHLGAFAVTSGHGLMELVAQFKADHDDYQAIMAEALADRLAEAFAEWLHRRVRREWGYGQAEGLSLDQLIDEQYRGIRPAAGYPACPDHTEKRTLWQLLDVEKNAGIKLTESCAMWPGSSVSGLFFAHPESKYFAVGRLGRDQVIDYAQRKGLPLPEAEKWLGPWLNYEPRP